MRKIIKFLISKTFVVTLLICVQIIFLVCLFYLFNVKSLHIRVILNVISYIMVLYIISLKNNPSYKLVWSIFILILPFIGGCFYIFFGDKKIPKSLFNSTIKKEIHYLDKLDSDCIIEGISSENANISKIFKYINNYSYYPVYKNSEIQYLKDGQDFLNSLLISLNTAKNTIYIEFFIISEGKMWDKILEVLIRKANDNIDVRIIFDDAGSVGRIKSNYNKKLEHYNIKCVVFNKLKPILRMQMNNRDHRKIVIIDDSIAYMGGINIGDEYINQQKRFGIWKDSAIKIQGDAVKSCTIMFIQMFNYLSEDKIAYNRAKSAGDNIYKNGCALPFSDCPTDNEQIGLNTHLMLINSATKYIYIETPYLIIDYKLQNALCLCAKSGVDVKIVLPFIPDKWYVHMVSKYNYDILVKSGVKIYEYLPGFIHSKVVIVDDIVGMCGSINMDYRSYYLHFECGVLLYKSKAIYEMKNDFNEIIAKSKLITKEELNNETIFVKIIRAFLNLFSPFM